MSKNITTPFGYKRILEYFKINCVIIWKKVLEYKANFFFYSIEHIIYLGSIFIVFNILFENFYEIIQWQLVDYVIFFILMDWISAIGGIFYWKEPSLFEDITSGRFNTLLIRPIKPFWGNFFNNMSEGLLIYTIANPFTHLTILFTFFNPEFYNITIAIIIWFMILLAFIVVNEFILSLDLIKIGLSNTVRSTYEKITFSLVNQYPHQYFKNFNLKNLLYVATPMFFVSSLLVPILRNYPIQNIKIQLCILIAIIIIFPILTLINWKIGLKKYEAFG